MQTTSESRAVMAAVVREKGGPFVIESARIRAPRGDEVRVRIVATGFCHADLIIRDQYLPVPLPVVLGHEGAGVAEAVGPDVRELAIGDPVVLSYGHCGHCDSCRQGQAAYCREFFQRNFGGGADSDHALQDAEGRALHDHFFAQSPLASYAIAHEANVIKVPDDVPLASLCPLGCGIQTGAGAVFNALRVAPGSRFLSLGAGAVGLAAIMAARAAGVTTIIAIDRIPARLALAGELGATW